MKADWVCHVDGQDYGPYTFEQMRQMAVAGQLAPTWHVRRHQDSQWHLASQVPGLFPKPSAQPKAKAAAAAPPAAVATSQPAAAVPQGTAAPQAVPKGSIPQGIPAGVPVGSAVAQGVPAGIPVGSAVAQGVPAGVPVGFSVSPGATSGFAVSVKPKAATTDDDDDAPTPRRKGGPLTTVYILGGVVAVLAVAVVGVLIWSSNRPAEEEEVAAAEAPAAAPAPELPAANPLPASNPAPPVNPALPVSTKASATAPAPTSPSAGAAQAAIKLVSSWNELDPDPKGPNTLKLKGTTTGVSIKMISTWLAADANGKPIAWKSSPPPVYPPPAEGVLPAGEGSAGAPESSPAAAETAPTPVPAPAVPSAPPEPGEIAKFVCAKIRITNTGKAPLNYKGWNAPGPDAAVAIDQADKLLQLAPVDAKSPLKRSGSVAIQPGESLDDLLVFAASTPPVLPIRLALPHQAVVSASKKAFGFQAAASYLAKDPSGEPPAASAAPAATAVAGPNAPALTIPGVLGDAPAAPAAAPKGEGEAMPPKPGSPEATAQVDKPKDGKPPSVLDIDKQIQELEGKGGAKPAPK